MVKGIFPKGKWSVMERKEHTLDLYWDKNISSIPKMIVYYSKNVATYFISKT